MEAIVRAPDNFLSNVPEFPFKPKYRKFEGLRLAHVDEGKGPPVVFIHGEPTWSFLWRKVIPPIRGVGYRCIALDLPGFGRSDKPIDVEWYTYDRHTASVAALFAELKLRDATIVVHDWGGPIGLRVAIEQPDRVGRMVILDTGLFTGYQKMTDSWLAFRELAARSEDLPVAFLIRAGCKSILSSNVVAAYEAPFPNPAAKAGARAFPLIVPTSPQMEGAATGQRVLEALAADPRPKLIIWGEGDPILPIEAGWRFARAIGADIDHVIKGVGHYLQEDAGHQVGRMIASWLKRQVPAKR
ncbi:MAG TPA: haloalkane dehalogenase [Solirubrobacteraceae bacterium]|nr:haloalkane dehalogenase [Solirubrobacteraceae bacterium]